MTIEQDAVLPSHVAGRPASVLDMSRWYLTLPEPDPDTGGVWDVRHPNLTTFVHRRWFYLGDDAMVWFVAPVAGRSTTPVGGARSQLREVRPDQVDAAWPWDGREDHVLLGTMTCDPTSIAGRRECIVAMIHDGSPTPPVYLSVNMNSVPGTLVLFVNGYAHTQLLGGLGPTDMFAFRISVTGEGAARRCYVTANPGDLNDMSMQPVALPVSGFPRPRGGCFFKAGAYNREPVAVAGRGFSFVRCARLAVV